MSAATLTNFLASFWLKTLSTMTCVLALLMPSMFHPAPIDFCSMKVPWRKPSSATSDRILAEVVTMSSMTEKRLKRDRYRTAFRFVRRPFATASMTSFHALALMPSGACLTSSSRRMTVDASA